VYSIQKGFKKGYPDISIVGSEIAKEHTATNKLPRYGRQDANISLNGHQKATNCDPCGKKGKDPVAKFCPCLEKNRSVDHTCYISCN